jgi:hypothetical protein
MLNFPVHGPLGRDPIIRSFERHLYAQNRVVSDRQGWGCASGGPGAGPGAAGDIAPRIPLQPTTSRSAAAPGHIDPPPTRK